MLKPWLLSMAMAMGPHPSAAAQEDVRPDVGFVPTPQPAVEVMLELANPRPGEVLFDLGCGDGRIVITAARRWNIQGRGVDIDPEMIRISRENARKAGVDHLVRFEQRNIFETDYREADIVALYLLTWINVSLRPRLLQQLHPGARVVAHQFGMEEWPPDVIRHVRHGGERHSVMLWIIPANCTGDWRLTAEGFPADAELRFEQLFQHANGTLRWGGRIEPLFDLTLRGGELAFTANREEKGGITPVSFSGRILGHRMRGRVRWAGGEGEMVSEWTAVRNPATMRSLEPSEKGRGPRSFRLKKRAPRRPRRDSIKER